MHFDDLPDWEKLLAAERHVQTLVPGTAAALHAGHRRSVDGDHVLANLKSHFDEVLAQLESAAGWRTERIQRPVLILGSIDGILTGIRQLRRNAALETEEIEGLCVPTLAEMARIKAWLLVTRNTLRDYLDTVVLLERLGIKSAELALSTMDSIYRQDNGASVLVELSERLAAGEPTDRAKVDLATYRGLLAPWNNWDHLLAKGHEWAKVVAEVALRGSV